MFGKLRTIANKYYEVVDDSWTIVGEGVQIAKDRSGTLNYEVPGILSYPDSFRKGHFWCFGTTRVGKTRILENLIEQDIRRGYSTVVIDPKGDLDLFAKIVQVAKETGRLDELQFITPIFPAHSAVVDPLSHHYMPEELVGHIVSGIEIGKEKFFFNIAYEISLAIVQALLLTRSEKDPGFGRSFNLNDVKNAMSREDLEKLAGEVDRFTAKDPKAAQLRRDMQKILDSPNDYYGKVSSSLRVALMELSSGHIGEIVGTAHSNKFIDRLEKGKRVIMVVHLGALITRKAAFTLGKVIVSMIQSFVGRVFSSGRKVTPPLSLFIDEAQSMLYYGIDDLFSKAGGADVWVHGFSQSVSQMYAVVGQDFARAILDNTNTKIFMKVPDTETAEYVAGHFGQRRLYQCVFGNEGGITVKENDEDFLKPQDIMGLREREFYMMTYSGLYKGRTLDVSPLYMNVEFPGVGGLKAA